MRVSAYEKSDMTQVLSVNTRQVGNMEGGGPDLKKKKLREFF